MNDVHNRKIRYHLPGLFEFYELYGLFLNLFEMHREYFYDWCEIGSIYGSPEDCLWGGGRVEYGQEDPKAVLALMAHHRISARLTLSNSLLTEAHLKDKKCNRLCKMLEEAADENVSNGVIVASDLLTEYLKEKYPGLYLVSSTTKTLTAYDDFLAELNRPEFSFVVPDFRLNKAFDRFKDLPQEQKDQVEFLCNECCSVGCKNRKRCYESVSRKSLGEDDGFTCRSSEAQEGYLFSKAMENPSFISVKDIREVYLPMGFTNFKIEGRGLGSAVVLECLLYYMVKPECQLRVREMIYLDSMLDLF